MAKKAKKRFYLIKRRNRRSEGKGIYCCRVRAPDGSLLSWKSTGQTSKTAAENWAIDHLNKGVSARETLTFRQYAEGWWLPECQYLVRKAARGAPVAPSYADVARSYLTRHILPQFGSARLDGITSQSIDSWTLGMKDQLSPATANRCLAVLRVMLREAERQGLIAASPAAEVQQLRETPRERGTLTLEEARRLLDENKSSEYWQSEIALAANLLSATSGMRLGEVLALRRQDIREGYLVVEHSWDRKHGLKTTKTRQVREIPIPTKTMRWLTRLTTNRSAAFVFSTDDDAPVHGKRITAELYKALGKMGITDKERRLRNLSFHSWRHFYNSLLRGRIPDAKLQRLTGHRTQQMTEHYSHFTGDDFVDVLTIQEELAI